MIQKIDHLTAEQEKQLASFYQEWLRIGLSTGPADLEAARQALNDFYARLGRSAPYLWRCESPLTAQLVMNVLANLPDNLWVDLKANPGADLWTDLENNLADNLRTSLGANLRDNLAGNLEYNLWGRLAGHLAGNLRDNLVGNLWDNLRANLRDNLGNNLRSNLWDSLEANLGDNLRDNLTYYQCLFGGSLDTYWIAYYLFPHQYLRPMHSSEQMSLLSGWANLARSVFWWYPFEHICFVCDRPQHIRRDQRGRLHSLDGSAVAFADGYAMYAVHGVRVPAMVIEQPECITLDMLEAERNVEVRRVLIDCYGKDRYVRDSDAQIMDQDIDQYGRLRALYRQPVSDDEPVTILRVTNSTPEMDGRFKECWLRVPPAMNTCQEAVAWTFEVEADDYAPWVET